MDIKVEYEPEIEPIKFVVEELNFPTPCRNIAIWSNEETKMLTDLYTSLINEVGSLKRFKRKKDMWMEISSHIPTKNFKQCEERIKTLLRRKKKGIEKVYVSDVKRKVLHMSDGSENEFRIIRKPKINYDTDECTTHFKEVHVWTNSETKLLMDLYKRLICEVGPEKKFMRKKDMWVAISKNFLNKDSKQCEQRYNTVLKRKKKGLTKVFISKARRKKIDFKSRRNEKINENHLLGNDNANIGNNNGNINETVEPDSQQKNESCTQHKSASDYKDLLTISETLLKIASKKEEGKERRHRERMDAMEKIQNILQQILNSKK